MSKSLPNVYAVPIEKKLKNNDEIFVSSKKPEQAESIPVHEIDKIFNSKEHVYKTKVNIKTNQEEKEVYVIGRTKEFLLTLDGEKFLFEDILEIKKV